MAFRPFPEKPDEVFDPLAEFERMMATAFTPKQIAEQLAISPRQVQAHIDDGSLIAVNVGRGGCRRDLRVLEEDLEGFLRRRRTAVEKIAPFPEARLQRPDVLPPEPTYDQRRAARLAGKKA